MHISFGSRKLGKVFEQERLLNRDYGIERAKTIRKLMSYLASQPNLGIFESEPLKSFTGFHSLKGNRNGQFAMTVTANYRLTIEANGTFPSLDCVDSITIIGVEDYH